MPIARPNPVRAFTVLALAGALWVPRHSLASEQNSGTPPAATGTTAISPADLALLARIIEEIGGEFIEQKTGHELMMLAARRLVSGLDKHSTLIENVSEDGMRAAMRGEFAGIGVELEIRDEVPVVVSTLPDSPARAAGLRVGDRIHLVDGVTMRGASLDDAIARIKGQPQTRVVLSVEGRGQAGIHDIALQRQLVRFRTVELTSAAGKTVVQVHEFLDMTTPEVIDQLMRLPEEQLRRGLVIDLRGNPGGVVDAAVEMASLFLPNNVLVMTVEGRPGMPQMPRLSARQHRLQGESGSAGARLAMLLSEVPLTVVVDSQTASSAEILAAALQAHRRARVVGCEPSMGKGSIQTIVQLTRTHAIKLTTARYRAPDGRNLEGAGVVPDVHVGDAATCATDATLVLSVAAREASPGRPQARSATPARGNGS